MRLLVDGNHLAARCRHTGLSGLSTTSGLPTGVLHGFIRALFAACQKTGARPEDVTVFWDYGLSPRRLAIYPEYKHRRRTPKEELPEADRLELEAYLSQLNVLRTGLPLTGICCVRVGGCEADDLLALYCFQSEEPAVIFSGDKDFHQLVGPTTWILNSENQFLAIADILEYWGLTTLEGIALRRACQGDASDDIGGVPGIGDVLSQRVAAAVESGRLEAEKDAKPLRKVWEHRHIVARNLEIMRLPRTLEEAGLSPIEQCQVVAAWSNRPKKNHREFAVWLRQYELEDIASRVNW
jgi:5'-3' exonuclease